MLHQAIDIDDTLSKRAHIPNNEQFGRLGKPEGIQQTMEHTEVPNPQSETVNAQPLQTGHGERHCLYVRIIASRPNQFSAGLRELTVARLLCRRVSEDRPAVLPAHGQRQSCFVVNEVADYGGRELRAKADGCASGIGEVVQPSRKIAARLSHEKLGLFQQRRVDGLITSGTEMRTQAGKQIVAALPRR